MKNKYKKNIMSISKNVYFIAERTRIKGKYLNDDLKVREAFKEVYVQLELITAKLKEE